MSDNILNTAAPEYEPIKNRMLALLDLLDSGADSDQIKLGLSALWDEFGILAQYRSSALEKLQMEIADLRTKNDNLRSVQDKTLDFMVDFFASQKLIKAIHSTYNLDSFCTVFIETLSFYVHVLDFGFYLIEDNCPILVFPEHIDPFFHHNSLSDWDEGVIDWVLREERPIVIEDIDNPTPEETYSILLAPMYISGKPLGFLRVRTDKPKNDFSSLELNIISFLAGQASLALANIRLITDLTSTKDFLQNLMDNANDLIIAFDPSGRINFVNRALENIGFTRRKLLSMSVTALFASPKSFRQILELRKLPAQLEIDIVNPAGDAVPHICTVSALSDFEGGLKEYIGVFKDISSHRFKVDQKIESERLAVVAETAIALNHELNNPLSIIMGHVYMLYAKAREMNEPALMEKIETIDRNLRRVVKIITKLQNIQHTSSTTYFDDLKMLDLNSPDK